MLIQGWKIKTLKKRGRSDILVLSSLLSLLSLSLIFTGENKISYNDSNINNNRHNDKQTTRIASVTIKGCQYLKSFIQNKEYLCVSLKSWQVNMT